MRGGVLSVDLASEVAIGYFAGGAATFTAGANAGATFRIKSHRQDGLRATIALWTPPGAAVTPGDAVTLTAGCDKSPATCQKKFDNIVNFRSFPHMPGNDRVIAYPRTVALPVQ